MSWISRLSAKNKVHERIQARLNPTFSKSHMDESPFFCTISLRVYSYNFQNGFYAHSHQAQSHQCHSDCDQLLRHGARWTNHKTCGFYSAQYRCCCTMWVSIAVEQRSLLAIWRSESFLLELLREEPPALRQKGPSASSPLEFNMDPGKLCGLAEIVPV